MLLRKLEGTDPALQENKVASLRLACAALDGTIIAPGETFSFWRIVGRPRARRGFRPGLQLQSGRLVRRTGGGLCQLSNLLHWMILHTSMEVVERHRHASDPFPDSARTIPFGSGATVYWNYLDLRFRNPTDTDFQVRTRVGESLLLGEIRASLPAKEIFRIEEKGHRFVRSPGGPVFRENELWRIRLDPLSGDERSRELLLRTCARVLYDAGSLPGIRVEEDPGFRGGTG